MFAEPIEAPVELQTISVTSQVIVSLAKLSRSMKVNKIIQLNIFKLNLLRNQDFDGKERLKLAVGNATRWLSAQLQLIDRDPHPYELASTAFGLLVADSVGREAAFQLLSKYRIETGNFMFWGSEDHVTNFDYGDISVSPNPILCCQSVAARATALALITYTRY